LKVLVDTSVWSLMLRRNPATLNVSEKQFVGELQDLVNDSRAAMIGAIRQELLSGIKHNDQFQALRAKLSVFDDVEITTAEYESAAAAANKCMTAGVPTTSIDVLICAVALERAWPIFTNDKGFAQFQKVLKFQMYAG
jgi:predicted nucleic acid-binding protein